MITLIMEGKFQDMGYMLTQVPPESLATPQVQDSLKYNLYHLGLKGC